MADELERFEEGLVGVERVIGRGKSRIDGMALTIGEGIIEH